MKKVLAMLLALTMVISLGACAGGGTGTADNWDKYAKEYGTIDGLYRDITMATRMDIEHLEPTAGTSTPKNEFYWNIYETLFDLNENNEIMSNLAKSYDVLNEGLAWDIHLYETIKDSEGNEITAEDVVASYDWLIKSGEAINFELVDSYEAVGDYTFRIHWKDKPTSIKSYEFPMFRAYIFDSQYSGNDFAKQPVGTGNYLVVDFVTGNHMTLWANKDYWALNTDEDVSNRMNLHTATVQQITYEVISEAATAEVALEKGTIDYCDYVNQKASIEKFRTDYADKYVVDEQIAQDYSFMQLNMDPSNVFLEDENLRLAIYYALDSSAIAQVMGASYLPMLTLGHAGFPDFNVEWENDSYYCGDADIDKAKEYLEKSSYDGQDFAIMCKSSEVEKNAAQSIMAQLMALGITCHLASVDPTIFQTSSSDPAQWDLLLFTGMGGTNFANSLGLPLGDKNSNEDGTDKWSLNFIRDKKLVELINAAQDDATRGDESLKAVIDYALENGYIYPLAYNSTCYIYSKEIIKLYKRETITTPGASTYAGQVTKEETAVTVRPVASDKNLSADFAGTYTYSEAANFGNKEHDFTLTLNADGTYKLECNNCVGENISTGGTFEIDSDGNVALSASPVSGDMDRLLNAGWADVDNPAPVFTVDKEKGTMVPANWETPEAETGGAEGEDASAKSGTPVIVENLSGNAAFEIFTYLEVGTPAGDVTWYVMKNDSEGMVIVACNNTLAGGDLVWRFRNVTEDKGLMTLDGLEDGDKGNPTMGAQWADREKLIQKWQITSPNTVEPAGDK
ncbi:MAG: ABC transporter substrate-binding protein [Lachnospiraceae bacterium]